MDAIKKAGYLLTTPMIICNTDEYGAVKPLLTGGEVAVGAPILEVKG
jgi:PTS system D-glucosamine-specific IIC component